MKIISNQDLKKKGAKSMGDDGQAAYVIVNSKPACVMVPVEMFEMLTEAFDIYVAEQRMNDGSETIPHEEVCQELGL